MPKLTNQQKVQQFHEAVGADVATDPTLHRDLRRARLRCRLIKEEAQEVTDEYLGSQAGNRHDLLAAVAKELADVLYVVYGAGVEMGIDVDAVFHEVHLSNMTKVQPLRLREDGKVLKGPNYKRPDIHAVLGFLEAEARDEA